MSYLVGKAENRFENMMKLRPECPSPQLTSTIKSVKTYLNEPIAARIRDVRFCWDAWKMQQVEEFKLKGTAIDQAFEDELLVEYRMRGIKIDADVDPEPINIPAGDRVVVNRWTSVKRGAKVGLAAASIGVAATGTGVGQGLGTIAAGLAAGTAVAVSATGVGLIATGLALTVGTSALSACAAWKSADHRDALMAIYEKRNQSPFSDEKNCQMAPAGNEFKTRKAYTEHDMIANHVLPYAIFQKDRKFQRRTFGAIPIFGVAESIRGAGNYLYKKYVKGNQGNLRTHAAAWLASHLITCDCLLVQAIVSELYSEGEMEWLKGQWYQVVVEHIERKLKST